MPDLIFVIDTNKEAIAISEARKLNIPVAAILDTNCDPDGITYPIPGNDDAGRAITLYCDLDRARGDRRHLAARRARRASMPARQKSRSNRCWRTRACRRSRDEWCRCVGRGARHRRIDLGARDARRHSKTLKGQPDGHHSADGERTA